MNSFFQKKQTASIDAIAVVSSELVSANLDGEVVILGFKSGSYYSLDQVGTFVWDLIQTPHKVSAIRDSILNEYNIDLQRCEDDLLDLLNDLADHGLIEIKGDTLDSI